MTQAHSDVRRGKRRSDNEGIRLKANWYKMVQSLAGTSIVLFPIPENLNLEFGAWDLGFKAHCSTVSSCGPVYWEQQEP